MAKFVLESWQQCQDRLQGLAAENEWLQLYAQGIRDNLTVMMQIVTQEHRVAAHTLFLSPGEQSGFTVAHFTQQIESGDSGCFFTSKFPEENGTSVLTTRLLPSKGWGQALLQSSSGHIFEHNAHTVFHPKLKITGTPNELNIMQARVIFATLKRIAEQLNHLEIPFVVAGVETFAKSKNADAYIRRSEEEDSQ